MDSSRRAVRNLLYHLIRRDLTVRYKSTVLGFLWSFLKPLALTGIFYLAFKVIIELPLDETRIDYPMFLLVGILAWTFFVGACGESLGVIVANANLIKKVRLPLAVFPVAAVCSNLVHFILAQFVLIILLIIANLPPSPAYLLFIPIMILQFLLVLGVALMLSALNVFYRDVASIWEILTTAWLYATPIIYPASQALKKLDEKGLEWLKWIYLANPMASIVLAYHRVLLYASVGPDPRLEISDQDLLISLAICICMTFLLLVVGWKIFQKFSVRFADEL